MLEPLASLGSFLTWCRKREYLQVNPLEHLRRMPTIPRVKRRLLTLDEIGPLLAVSRGLRRLLYETALLTGLRANELRQLTLEHLDIDRGELRLDTAWTKNRQLGSQPFPGQLVADLYHAGRHQRQLLTVPHYTARQLYTNLARAGIPQQTAAGKVDFHALRVTYINLLMDYGATATEAQRLARHETVDLTVTTYGRTRESRLHALVEGIAEHVLGMTRRAPGVHAVAGRRAHPVEPGVREPVGPESRYLIPVVYGTL